MNLLIPIFSPPTGSWGSLTRLMAIANKFIKEGHSIAFCASGYVKETLIEKGFKTYEIPEMTILSLPKFLSNIISKRSKNLSPPAKKGRAVGNIWLLFNFTGYNKTKTILKLVKSEIEAIKDFKPDAILTEMELASYVSAYIMNIPMITTYAKISSNGKDSFFYKKIKRRINRVLKKYSIKDHIEPYELAFGKNVLKLIPSIPELDTTDSNEMDVCYTGNLLEPIQKTKIKFIPEPNKKYIFCYFGTGSINIPTVIKILPKVINKMKNTVCYVASQSICKEFNIKNIYFVKYVQASEILPHCKVTICHGGLNTITQSLEAGVPLIIFPGAIFERRFNAQKVAEAKGGYMGELADFNEKWITEKIKNLNKLDANRLKKEFHKYHGIDTAYNKIIDWVNSKN